VKASYRSAVETSTAAPMKSSASPMKTSTSVTAMLRKDRQWQQAETDKDGDYAKKLNQCALLHCSHLYSISVGLLSQGAVYTRAVPTEIVYKLDAFAEQHQPQREQRVRQRGEL
jgi:hypothetical protein